MKTVLFNNKLFFYRALTLAVAFVSFAGMKLSAQSPSASITSPSSSTTSILAGKSVTFTGTRGGNFNGSTYSDYTYTWSAAPTTGVSFSPTSCSVDWDDNNSQTTATFNNTGAFSVKLTITRSSSTAVSATKTINVFTVNAGSSQTLTLPTNSASLSGSVSGPGSKTYAWTKVSGPYAYKFSNSTTASTTVSGLMKGVYVFRLTVNGNSSLYDDVTITVNEGSTTTYPANLFSAASPENSVSSGGTRISGFAVSSAGVVINGPNQVFDPFSSTDETTAALGKDANGYYYYLPNNTENDGKIKLYAVKPNGTSKTEIASFDFNGYSDNSDLGFVRLGMDVNGYGWILAGNGNKLYLAKFKANGINSTTISIVNNNVAVVGGGSAATFYNGDLAFMGNGTMYALANDGNGVTNIYTMPSGNTSTLTKKWSLVDHNNVPFAGRVNGTAFDSYGSMYISTDYGLYYIDQYTVNSATGTVKCFLVWDGNGLTDLATNFFPMQSVLPITLGDFTVSKQSNVALLKWSTLTEMNTNRFEIERSEDGVSFRTIGTVSAKGTSSETVNYTYNDPLSTISAGIIYYRLRVADTEGKATYTKIVSLKLNSTAATFSVYPNPFSSDIKVNIRSEKESDVTIRISNIAGQQVVNRSVILQPGDNVVVLKDFAALKPGTHLLEIIMTDGKLTQKIVKK